MKKINMKGKRKKSINIIDYKMKKTTLTDLFLNLLLGIITLFSWLDKKYIRKCPVCKHEMMKWRENRYDCTNCTYKEYL